VGESPPYPYTLGSEYPVMPMAPIAAHCVSVDAGAVTLVVEARDLVRDRQGDGPVDESDEFDDYGASLHVHGANDGVERLRFDCFDKEPHYHYIRPADNANVIIRLDNFAEGDPIEWTMGRLRTRLPEMLEHADAQELADSVRADMPSLLGAVDEVGEMLAEAQRRTIERRSCASGS
jgi:hypothetical protein